MCCSVVRVFSNSTFTLCRKFSSATNREKQLDTLESGISGYNKKDTYLHTKEHTNRKPNVIVCPMLMFSLHYLYYKVMT